MSNGADNKNTGSTESTGGETKQQDQCHACSDCPHVNPKEKLCKRLKNKYSMKRWVFALIAFACFSGIIAPFIAQYLAPRRSALEVALSAWNQYVSIILGIVATLLSIVSLVFSFHNEEEENIQQRNSDAQFEALKTSVIKLEKDFNTAGKTMSDMSKAIESVDKKMSIYFENGQRNTTTAESKTNGEEITDEIVD
jgi:hypothetical protein